MAPIDPNELLKAFKPLLTILGGIKSEEEVPRLSGLMDKYSKKLVSRCTYCNILIATKDKLLDSFLNQRGWIIINSWLKDAINSDNNPFINDLLTLFDKCPMTVERLKQNNTPKLIKSLIKSQDPEIAEKAKQVRNKWASLISVENTKEEEAKRKRERDKQEQEPDQNKKRIKLKINLKEPENVSKEINTDMNNKKSTAKVRLGKNRGICLIEQSKDKNKIKSDDVNSVKLSSPGQKSLVDKSRIEKKSISPNQLQVASKPATSTAKAPSLKESGGFMEDIVNTSLNSGQVRKRKKSDSKKIREKDDKKMNIEKSSDDVNDLPAEDEDTVTSDELDETSANNNEKAESFFIEGAIQPDDLVIKPDPFLLNSNVDIKSILSTKTREGTKKTVRWKNKAALKEVFYFELDETERCNVSKLDFGEIRNLDIRKERQMLSSAKKENIPNRTQNFLPWRLITLELPHDHLVIKRGSESEEKKMREKLTSQSGFHLPREFNSEYPSEPDASQSGAPSGSSSKPQLIPLDSGRVLDFSNQPAPMPKTNDLYPIRPVRQTQFLPPRPHPYPPYPVHHHVGSYGTPLSQPYRPSHSMPVSHLHQRPSMPFPRSRPPGPPPTRFPPRSQIPCRFYGRSGGCKHPTKCPYMHGPPANNQYPPNSSFDQQPNAV